MCVQTSMSKIHLEILDKKRQLLLPVLRHLPRGGVLGGGTALALTLGHRRSFDFDVFYSHAIPSSCLLHLKRQFGKRLSAVVIDSEEELTVSLDDEIKLTLLHFPFKPLYPVKRLIGAPVMFDARDLASNKAYAIGRRGTWRDYVDMHAWLSNGHTLESVIRDAENRFKEVFSSRLFLEQLVYSKDLGPFVVDFLKAHTATRQRVEKELAVAVKEYLSQRV